MNAPWKSVAELLRRELQARKITRRALAKHLGVRERTVGRYVNGTNRLPPNRFDEAIAYLKAQGPFHHPELQHPQVRAQLHQLAGTQTGIRARRREREPVGFHVDLLVLAYDVPEPERPAVVAYLEGQCSGERPPRDLHPGARYVERRVMGDGAIAYWEPVSPRTTGWLRLRLKPRASNGSEVADQLGQWLARPDAPLADPPRVVRIDLAVDYDVEPYWFLMSRPRAKHFTRMEDKDGVATWYLGNIKRKDKLVRVYDAGRFHKESIYPAIRVGEASKFAPPLMRIEAEWNVQPAMTFAELAESVEQRSPFAGLFIHDLWAADLDPVESAMLLAAQLQGITWYRSRLRDPRDAERFESALRKSRSASRLRHPNDVLKERAPYLAEWLRVQTLPEPERPWT